MVTIQAFATAALVAFFWGFLAGRCVPKRKAEPVPEWLEQSADAIASGVTIVIMANTLALLAAAMVALYQR